VSRPRAFGSVLLGVVFAGAFGSGCLCGGGGGGDGLDASGDGRDGAAGGPDGAAGGGDAAATDGGTALDGGPNDCLAIEVCGDGADNDCDGTVDEDCVCAPPGDVRECYTGASATLGVGRCLQGTQVCGDPMGEFSYWGDCIGEVLPAAETCNGLDDDCDGMTDDGLGMLSCGVGACAATVPACAGGVAQTCTPGSPSPEVCDAIDNDCNGVVDDAPGASCELCNGMDDDGDGLVDEGLGWTTCGMGLCAVTQLNCVGGLLQTCMPGTPGTEICDGNDNDCDGVVDEGLGVLSCGVGACAATTPACSGGMTNVCTPGAPSAEICDGNDNDCDGAIDEGLGMSACGVGACARTTANCIAGIPQTCTPGAPVGESCNGVDDDCDGMIDEGGVCGVNMPPAVSCPGAVTASTLDTVMLSATATDSDGTIVSTSWTVTSAPVGSSSSPMPPSGYATSFWLDLAGSYVLTFCATDDDGATSCCSVPISSVPSEDLRVELFWDPGAASSTADVDLHLLYPTAPNWFSATLDCYFANCVFGSLAWPPAGAAGNPSLDVDDVNGYGPENINVNLPGLVTYKIGVHYWDDHGQGPTTATVRVWCWGTMVYESAPQTLVEYGPNAPTNDFWKVANVTWTGTGAGCSVAVVDTIVTGAAAMSAP
jgi:hypothetical protein